VPHAARGRTEQADIDEQRAIFSSERILPEIATSRSCYMLVSLCFFVPRVAASPISLAVFRVILGNRFRALFYLLSGQDNIEEMKLSWNVQ
jgi:hypothetical protein